MTVIRYRNPIPIVTKDIGTKFPSGVVENSLSICQIANIAENANGITMDEEGNYYIANFSDGNVIKVTAEGKASILLTIPGDNNGHIMFHSGYLYVVGRSAHSIYKVSLSGKMELFAGTGERGRTNGDRLKSTFNYPNDLDFSPDGKFLYVNEQADTVGDPRILTPTIVRRIRME